MSTLRERIEALAKEWEERPDRLTVWGTSAAALRSVLESETREAIRRCTDCGGTTFDRDGARALDEARKEGRRAGISEAETRLDSEGYWLASALLREWFELDSTPPPANTENDR